MTNFEPEETFGGCVLCSIKHVAKAKALMLEAKNGYPMHYWDATANLSLAEEHLIMAKLLDEAAEIRDHRKRLELDPWYELPFDAIVNRLAKDGGFDVRSILTRRQNDTAGVRIEPGKNEGVPGVVASADDQRAPGDGA